MQHVLFLSSIQIFHQKIALVDFEYDKTFLKSMVSDFFHFMHFKKVLSYSKSTIAVFIRARFVSYFLLIKKIKFSKTKTWFITIWTIYFIKFRPKINKNQPWTTEDMKDINFLSSEKTVHTVLLNSSATIGYEGLTLQKTNILNCHKYLTPFSCQKPFSSVIINPFSSNIAEYSIYYKYTWSTVFWHE